MTSQLLDSVLLATDIPELELHASGKVRDVYKLDNDRLLFVATDRISAFDYVLATGIPHKGRVLAQISLFWFEFLKDVVPNHLITADGSPPGSKKAKSKTWSSPSALESRGSNARPGAKQATR